MAPSFLSVEVAAKEKALPSLSHDPTKLLQSEASLEISFPSEHGLVITAVTYVWNKHKSQGTIEDVAHFFENISDLKSGMKEKQIEIAQDIALSLVAESVVLADPEPLEKGFRIF